MEKIDEQLKNMAELGIPIEVHQSVMRAVKYRSLRPIFLIGFFLLVFAFVLSAWHINVKLLDAEFGDMMRDFFGSFELSFDFIGAVFGSFFEIVSPALFLSGVFSLFGLLYLGRKIKTYEFGKIKTA